MAIKEHFDLIAPVVDVQPAYNILVTAKSSGYPDEVKQFAIWKLRQTIHSLRETADFIEKEIGGPEKKAKAR